MLKNKEAIDELVSFAKENGYNFSNGEIAILYYSTYNFFKKLQSGNPEQIALNAVKKGLTFNENFDNTLIIAECITLYGYDNVKNKYDEKGMDGIKYLHLEIKEYYDKVRLKKSNTEQKTIDTIAKWYLNHPQPLEFQYYLSQKGIDFAEYNNMDDKSKSSIIKGFAEDQFRKILKEYSLSDMLTDYPDEMPNLFINIITADEPNDVVAQFKQKKNKTQDMFKRMYVLFDAKKQGLSFGAFKHGLIAYLNAKKKGILKKDNIFTIVDFTKPSNEKRLFVLDMVNKKIIMKEYVAHGKGKGNKVNPHKNVRYVGNRLGSNLSPNGLLITAEGKEYKESKNGYILRIEGVEKGFNDNTKSRGVYIHKAIYNGLTYVSDDFAKAHGYVGESQGCLAVDPKVSDELIDTVKGGSGIFIYFPTTQYMANSEYMKEKEITKELVMLF
ncbi:murein L,D-transpeptidase catalytic domain family protein [Candidatus Micrarchaeota archaeon]|nr:murein L,D-transpeptidase catalytic domain family protein [Candidatus Micrarchaeota archaeon]